MAKYMLFLTLLVAWACFSITAAEEEGEETSHTREKRQGGFFPGSSFNLGQQGGQGSFPFGGGNLGFSLANPFGGNQRQPVRATPAPQHQSFVHNTPQTFEIGSNGGFVPAGFQPGGGNRPAGGRPNNPNFCRRRQNRNHPLCQNTSNRPINCNRRKNKNKPECQNQNQTPPSTSGQTTSVSEAFQQIPWLNQLSQDRKSISIPNLPKTPAVAGQSRFFLLGTGRPDVPFQQCVTPRFERGHCRYLQHCILPEFANNFNQFLRYVCFIEGRYVGVCCPDHINTNGITQPPPPTTPPPTTPRPTTPASQSRGCGLIAKRPPTRIVGGRPADPQEWPWMAALMRNGATQYCGGTLITDRHVLTAAHCVDGFDQNSIRIRLGEYSFDRKDDSAHIDFNVAAIRMHTGYDRNTYVNDIAIMALDRPTTFNADIWPVCLPEGDESYERENATVTGWGTIYYGGPVASVLQEVTVPIWTNRECDDAYEQNIIDKQLCAGAKQGGKDSCQGDSGGPLLLQIGNENRWAVVGVVSWGIRCAEINKPGVYTRVSKYRDWIRNNSV